MTKDNDNDPDHLFRNKNVTKDVKRKVLAEKKAHELVKQLLEENIDREFFVKSVYFLSAQHYQDVNEERSILKICGYPLCDQPLKKVLKQQYRIANNRVFDLSRRKLFCSDRCYKASDHVAKQIPTSPLWLRDPNEVEHVKLYLSESGSLGEEIPLRARLTPSNVEHVTDKDPDDTSGSEPDETEFQDNVSENEEPLPVSSNFPHSPEDSTSSTCSKTNSTRTKQEKRRGNPVDDVTGTLRQWLTKETLLCLGLIEPPEQSSSEITVEELRKMKKLQLLDKKLNKVVSGISDSKSAEGDAMEVYTQRVEMFYRGRMSESGMVRFKEAEEKVNEKHNDLRTPIYPHIDSKNQASIRRNILHQKLAKVCQDLFPSISPFTISHDVKELIFTFNLTNSNVVLKTSEYPLMCILIMLLISKRNEEVERFITQSETFIKHVLSAYQLKLSTLQNKISQLIEAIIVNS